jgi:hypothetical protein
VLPAPSTRRAGNHAADPTPLRRRQSPGPSATYRCGQGAALAPNARLAEIPRAAHNAVTTAGPAVAAHAMSFRTHLAEAGDG